MEEDLRDLVWIGSNLLCRWNPPTGHSNLLFASSISSRT